MWWAMPTLQINLNDSASEIEMWWARQSLDRALISKGQFLIGSTETQPLFPMDIKATLNEINSLSVEKIIDEILVTLLP